MTPLRDEFYLDREAGGFALAGNHDRLTKQEVEATFASFGEDDGK